MILAFNTTSIEDNIMWLVSKPTNSWEKRYKPHYGTAAAHDQSYRRDLATAFINAAETFDVPVNLLVAIGYRETVFRLKNRGDHGFSRGIMQVGHHGRVKCKQHCKNVETDVQSSINCGACWLSKGRDWCGTIEQGLVAYCTGSCKTTNKRALATVQSRVKLWEKMK